MEQTSYSDVPRPYLSWALAKKKGQEHVSLPNFVRRFQYTDKESAYSGYATFIQSSHIDNKRRVRLEKAYTDFKLNREREFWVTRNSYVDTVVSAKEAAIVTRGVGLKQTKFDYNQYLSNLDHIGQGNTSSTVDWGIDDGQDVLISDDSEDGEEDIDESNNDAEDLDDNGSTVNEELVADVGAVSTLNTPPFRDFVKYIYQKVQGSSSEMPRIPDNISANHKELLEYALQILSANSRSQNFILIKDVLVLLSGIVNTVSPDVISKLSLAPVIKQESALPSFNVREESVKGILRDILLALCPEYDDDQYAIPLMANLQTWIWRELSVIHTSSDASSIVKRKLLVVVSYICTLLESNQLIPPSTEHVFVSVWTYILNYLLDWNIMRGIPGELGSSATKDARLVIESEFGNTTKYVMGRKVDVSLRINADFNWESEVAVFEFKPKNVSTATCNKQQKKAVRINAAILLGLEKRGLDIGTHFPVIAEGRGLVLDLYALRRYEDVLGAGKTARAWLPYDELSLKEWLLSDSVHILLAFTKHTRSYANS
ncbi:hypothetical protein BGZ79_004597, partial [Entomortierella chlamydospora]